MAIGPQVTAVVTAQDNASETLKHIAALAKQVSAELKNQNGGGALKSQLDLANAAAGRHVGAVQSITRAYSAAASAAKQLAGFAAVKVAFGLEHGAIEAIKGGAELAHAEIGLKVAGIPQADLEAYKRQIAQIQTTVPNVSTEGALELAKELRSVLLDVKEVPALLPTMLKARASIEAGGGDSHGLGFLVKGAELLGYAQDPAKFERYINAAVKAQQVMGRLVSPESIFEIAKYEKASGRNLSERFQFTSAVSLAQELGGSTLGKSIDQFEKTIVGAVNNHAALKVAASYGLINHDDIIWTKQGEAKGLKAGKQYAGGDEAQKDPDRWIWERLAPALAKHGDTSDEKIAAAVRKLFPAGGSADFVLKALSQRESLENHAKLYEAAKGIGAHEIYNTDALTGLKTLGVVLHDFGSIVTEPGMQRAAGVLSDIALGLSKLKAQYLDWAGANPKDAERVAYAVPAAGAIAAGGGLLGGYKLLQGLLGGGALTGSATALDASAAALTAAATALEGAAGVQAGKSAIGAAEAAGMGWRGKLGLLGGVAGMGYLAYRAYDNTKDASELPPENALERFGAKVDSYIAAHWGRTPQAPSAETIAAVEAAKKFNQEQAETVRAIRARRERDAGANIAPSFLSASHVENGKVIIGSPMQAQPTKPVDVNVSGDVKGQVDIMQRIVVEPSPMLHAIVGEAKRATANITGAIHKLGFTSTLDNGIVPAPSH